MELTLLGSERSGSAQGLQRCLVRADVLFSQDKFFLFGHRVFLSVFSLFYFLFGALSCTPQSRVFCVSRNNCSI